MTTSKVELLAGFADPAIAFARELGMVAKSRSTAHVGEVQPVPEMYSEGSAELREWRREYGHDGRKSTWPRVQTLTSLNKQQMSASGVTSLSHPDESFALNASKPSMKPTTTRGSTGTKTTTASQPDRAKSATATSTKVKKSATSAIGARPAESPEPAAQDEIERLLSIGVTEEEAHELVVVGRWTCESLVCAVETKAKMGVSMRVVGLL